MSCVTYLFLLLSLISTSFCRPGEHHPRGLGETQAMDSIRDITRTQYLNQQAQIFSGGRYTKPYTIQDTNLGAVSKLTQEAPIGFDGSQDMQHKPGGGAIGNPTQSGGLNSVEVVAKLDGKRSFNTGKHYEVEYKDCDGNSKDTIIIKGKPGTGAQSIKDTFQPPCEQDVKRKIYYSDDTILIGGILNNFLVYGNMDVPDRLIVFEGGKYKIKTYSSKGISSNVLDEGNAEKVKSMLKDIQYELTVSSSRHQQKGVKSEQQRHLNDLLKTFPAGAPGKETSEKPKDNDWLDTICSYFGKLCSSCL